ncbi:MAG TPA: alpha/beta fold hydrolase [Caldilineaceae bacterium]|nr:alpha/beta fold hydrolase [Caldilineaceae bacterium]
MKTKSTFFLALALVTLVTTMLPGVLQAQPGTACAADVVVRAGDTLSSLAGRYLGNPAAYNAIVEATNARAASDASYARIVNANSLAVGMKLCIPAGGTQDAGGPVAAAPLVTVQPVATATPGGSPTPLPTPTATPTSRVPVRNLNQLSIEWARGQSYPGSDIVIEETLTPGANYSRYLTSYRSEGLKIYALLTVPNGAKPASGWPVIIFNHGYIPPEIYRTTERYVAYVDGFARNGYIVFRPDYRGHGFSEGEALGGYGTPDYTIDVLNALASIKRYSAADVNRIGMWGHSMGGYITLRSMVISHDIKAGVIWAGVVASYPDMINNWRRPVPATIPTRARRWRQELISQYGTPEENPAFWASISANSYLADLSGPLQLHQGTNDEDVNPEFSATLKQQLDAAGQPSEYYVYEGDNHNLSINFNTAMQRSLEFFDRYLKPKG